jgi:hypothetical protein
MKINHSGILLIFSMVLTLACVDPITFETASETGQLVFYGEFTQVKENHVFTVARTSEFGKPTIPLSGAAISIFDDLGNAAPYVETDNGKYILNAESFQGVPGRFYHVEITSPDGRNLRSLPQTMPEPIEIDDLYFKIEPQQILSSSGIVVDQTFISIYINTSLKNQHGESGGMRWTVEEVYSFTDLPCHPYFDPSTTCYFKIPPNDSHLKIFKSEANVQPNLDGYQILSRMIAPDDEFVERHYFSVYQYTISQETYNFWEQVQIVTSQAGDLLDRPAAAVIGNIFEKDNPDNHVLGYFEVSGKNTRRIYTLPHLIGDNHILETCPPQRNSIIQDKCCFCYMLDEAENRVERPEYWGD